MEEGNIIFCITYHFNHEIAQDNIELGREDLITIAESMTVLNKISQSQPENLVCLAKGDVICESAADNFDIRMEIPTVLYY